MRCQMYFAKKKKREKKAKTLYINRMSRCLWQMYFLWSQVFVVPLSFSNPARHHLDLAVTPILKTVVWKCNASKLRMHRYGYQKLPFCHSMKQNRDPLRLHKVHKNTNRSLSYRFMFKKKVQIFQLRYCASMKIMSLVMSNSTFMLY